MTQTTSPWTASLKFVAVILLAAWAFVAYLLGSSGLLAPDAPQPFQPVALTVVVPVLVFALFYLRSDRVRRFVLAQDIHLLTQLQLWRVVGFTFLALYAFDVLPALFAWPAGFGDVAIGLGAVFVVMRLTKDPGFARSGSFVTFHVLGLLDFLGAVGTAALASGAFPAIYTGATTTDPMALWPLNIFPSFLVPIFIILHLTVLLQVREARREPSRQAYIGNVPPANAAN